MAKSVTQNQKVVMIIQPQAIADNASWVGSLDSTPVTIDTAGWNELTIYVAVGATDIAMTNLEVHSSDEADANFTAVDGLDWGTDSTIPSADDDDTVHAAFIELDGKAKRYYRLEADAGNGSAGTYAVAWAVLSRPTEAPNSAAERGLTTELFLPAAS